MAFNPFVGKTVAQLLEIRSKIQDEIASGSQLQSASAGDVQSSRIIQTGPYERFRLVQLALYRLDPDTYPLSEVPARRSVAVMGAVI